jgi:hypothetical protein
VTALGPFLDALGAATLDADRAEAAYRADFARQVAILAEARAFAFRRLNLIRAVAETVGRAEDPETAIAYGVTHLRHRLGWSDSEGVRDEILERFAPVSQALFLAQQEPSPADEAEAGDEAEPPPDPAAVLAAFESWYAERVGTPFWLLFENQMRETPLVDF